MSGEYLELSGVPLRRIPWKAVDQKRSFVILEIINSIYLFLGTEEISFFLLAKSHTGRAVSIKSAKKHIPGNETEFLKNGP